MWKWEKEFIQSESAELDKNICSKLQRTWKTDILIFEDVLALMEEKSRETVISKETKICWKLGIDRGSFKNWGSMQNQDQELVSLFFNWVSITFENWKIKHQLLMKSTVCVSFCNMLSNVLFSLSCSLWLLRGTLVL